jgi:outer membrane biosynthesis protein TonB
VGNDAYWLCYFQDPKVTLADAAKELALFEPQLDGEVIVIGDGEPHEIYLGLSDEPHVVVEAAETAARRKLPELAACARRFEVTLPDLEGALQEFNTMVMVQEALQRLTRGWQILSWNDNLVFDDADRGPPAQTTPATAAKTSTKPAKKQPAKKQPAKKQPAKKPPAKKPPAKKPPAKKPVKKPAKQPRR